jgi:hypothetical protein
LSIIWHRFFGSIELPHLQGGLGWQPLYTELTDSISRKAKISP